MAYYHPSVGYFGPRILAPSPLHLVDESSRYNPIHVNIMQQPIGFIIHKRRHADRQYNSHIRELVPKRMEPNESGVTYIDACKKCREIGHTSINCPLQHNQSREKEIRIQFR